MSPTAPFARPTRCPEASMRLRLVTIPISHYCEKARWALERAGLAYTEEPHLQLVHRLGTARRGQASSVPMLVTGRMRLTDSADILRWTDAGLPEPARLYPDQPGPRAQATKWAARFDADLGPASRAWMYLTLAPERGLVMRYGLAGLPPWQRGLAALSHGPLVGAIRRTLALSPGDAGAQADVVDREFAAVAERLSRRGKPYLAGDRFTAADLTFACMAAPAVLPREYGVPLPPIEELPGPALRRVEGWRAHPAGQFALRLFREHRRHVVAGPSTRSW